MRQSGLDFTGPFVFDPQSLAIAPSPHRAAQETSALAAAENTASTRRATQNTTLLALIRAAGETGISDIELHRATGIPRQSICARRLDLRSLLEPCGRYVDPQTTRSYTRWRAVA